MRVFVVFGGDIGIKNFVHGGTIFAYLNRFCNIFSVLHKGRILMDALLNEPTCINKRKSRRNAEEYTMPQNRKRKFQKGE